MMIEYEEEHFTPNDPNMEFGESLVNPFDPVPPLGINDWRDWDEDYW